MRGHGDVAKETAGRKQQAADTEHLSFLTSINSSSQCQNENLNDRCEMTNAK